MGQENLEEVFFRTVTVLSKHDLVVYIGQDLGKGRGSIDGAGIDRLIHPHVHVTSTSTDRRAQQKRSML